MNVGVIFKKESKYDGKLIQIVDNSTITINTDKSLVKLESQEFDFLLHKDSYKEITNSKAIYHYILQDELLSDAFKYVILNNTSNNAPYHHFHHMITVTKWCIILNYKELESNRLKNYEFYELILAAMFHDMNHSMGEFSDEENVTNTIKSFHKWNTNQNINGKTVENIIKATQYPYILMESDLNTPQKIIRDADLMVWMEDDWLQNAILGLNKEMNVNDLTKLLEGNLKFHQNIKMNTAYGNLLYITKWDEHVFTPINRLLELIK